MILQVVVSWILTVCNVVDGYWCLGGAFCLHLQGLSTQEEELFRLCRQVVKQHGVSEKGRFPT